MISDVAVVETPAQQAPVGMLGKHVPGPAVLKAQEVLDDPKMILFTDFLSPEECAHLIEICEGRWIRSTVTRGKASDLLSGKQIPGAGATPAPTPAPDAHDVAEGAAEAEAADGAEDAEGGEGVESAASAEGSPDTDDDGAEETEVAEGDRGVDVSHLMSADEVKRSESSPPEEVTSSRCTSRTVRLEYGESAIVERVIARVATVTGHRMDHIEQLVLVRYAPGETFMLHHDGGHRPMTVFMYLNDVEEGGETYFPELGFKVKPATGTAVMWSNVVDDGEGNLAADRRMDHEAIPPARGIKYGMNCFVSKSLQRDCSHIKVVQKKAGA